MIPTDLTGIDRVRRAIELLDLKAEIVSPGVSMPTVPLAAAAIGCHENQIIKTVVFTTPDLQTIVAIATGTGRIDRTSLAAVLGVSKVRLADPEFVLERTGCPAGGVSPVGFRDPDIRIVIDTAVLEQQTVYGGAGTEDDLLKMDVVDLIRVTGGLVATIVN